MIPIYFETVSRYDEKNLPVSVSIPFAEGEFFPAETDQYQVADDDGTFLTQTRVSGTYPDGSVKYLLVLFAASFKADRKSVFSFATQRKQPSAAPHPVMVEKETDGSIVIDTGVLSCRFGHTGEHPFRDIVFSAMHLSANDLEGVSLINGQGKHFLSVVGVKGWSVIESGPVRAVIRTHGRHISPDGSEFFDYQLTITAYAGQTVLRCAHQIINTEKSTTGKIPSMTLSNEQAGLKYDTSYPYELLAGAEMTVKLPEAVRKRIFTSSFNAHVDEAGTEEVLSRTVTADTIITTPNEMFPEVLFSIFAGDWITQQGALACSEYQAYQNFPKAITMDGTKTVLSLFPESHQPVKIGQGVAKTLRFDLFFHDPEMEKTAIIDRLLLLEMPPVGYVDVKRYMHAGVFGKEVSDLYHHPTERFIYRFVDSRAKGLGFLNFGDCPEWEYVKQGRSSGKDIWINNEYDMPHNFMILFARSGDRRYHDYLMAAVRHWMDVDFCHYSEQPYHEGLLYTHSIDHVSGQPVPSHQWVEGFLDYYHLTGDPSGLDYAVQIGEGLLSLIQLPIYNKPGQIEPREIGWALRALLTLYSETHQKKYLDACRPIIGIYERWASMFGTWTSPYPDNFLDRVPFMMHVGLVGLHGYYKITQDPEVRKTMLAVINDLVKNCLNSRLNMFPGKMHPSIRYQNLNGMVLESLEIGYELTNDVSYLKAGLGMFKWITVENQPPVYDFSKIKRDDFTVIYNCPVGPKRCAQTLIPLLRYYTAILQEGLLPLDEA